MSVEVIWRRPVSRVPTFVKVLIIVSIVILLIGGAFFALGAYVNNTQRVMPNIRIDDVNVSGLTHDEVIRVLGVYEKEQRIENAAVTVRLPGGSEITVTSEDAQMQSNVRNAIDWAVAYGRGEGFVADTVSYMNSLVADIINLNVFLNVDVELLQHTVDQLVGEYNFEFGGMTPSVNDDYITITLGAGHTSACADEIFNLIFAGLYESFETGQPVVLDYITPETPEFRIVAELESLWQETRVLPICAQYDRYTRTFIPEETGVSFDFTEAVTLLRTADVGEPVTIDMIILQPKITQAYLETFLFLDIIGEETTHVGGSENRLHNVWLAAYKIHGLVLEPGEEFSFNRVVGRRTTEAGFRSAPILSGGQFIPGIGGGICQVSSTLFSAIKDTPMQITEQRRHGRPIGYLPWGRDATVAWGHIDFRFINNTERPIRIDFELEGRTLTARVYGTWPADW